MVSARAWLTRRFWDAHSSGWEKVASSPDATARRRDLVDAICAEVAVGARIVDLGCGAGHLATELAVRGFRITGADFSTGMLKRARQRALEAGVDLAIEQVDLDGRFPWNSGSFDAAVSNYVLQVLADPVAFLAKAATIVRPSGCVVIVAPTRASDRSFLPTMSPLERVLNEFKRATSRLPGGVQWYNSEHLRQVAVQAGLAVSSITPHRPAVRLIATTTNTGPEATPEIGNP